MEYFEPQITAFCCHNAINSESKALDEERLQTAPNNIKVIEMPCGGKTDVLYLLKAFELGADGVCVVTCPEEECHFLEGNLRAESRVKYAKEVLDEIKLESDRLQIYHLYPPIKEQLQKIIDEMIAKIKGLGPSPLRRHGGN